MKLLPCLLLAACALPAQGVDEDYIPKIFLASIGETPSMGWFDPQRGFLTDRNASEVFLYAPAGMPATGRRVGEATGAEIVEIQKNWIACEIEPDQKLTVLDVGRGAETGRALYTTKELPGQSRSGLVKVPLTAQQIDAVNRKLGWPRSGVLRRDEAYAARTQSFFYSIHRLYSSKTRLLQQEAIVLHGNRGEILAVDLHRNLDTEPFCADCENPGYEDEVGLFLPLNMFETAAFPYPLVLLDSGTIEGRALSLRTFTRDGKAAEFRVYEYVVNCG